jgi:UDP-3-O-[3-hydroxymyristoyl] glucosamine N-acyltransferase
MPRASEIAKHFHLDLIGKDLNISQARSLETACAGSVVFLGRNIPGAIARLNAVGELLCVTTAELAQDLTCSVVIHRSPRYVFCMVLKKFFFPEVEPGIHETACVASDAVIGEDAHIGPGCVIGRGVRIGSGAQLHSNVVVSDGTLIGRDCAIKSNTTIGEEGFGFARDENGRPVHFPHIGGVRIGDRVVIGANCTVVRAALDMTVIEDDVKTDDHVHIAHNCHIGAGTLIAAGAVLSGNVTVGAEAWISPNSTIIDYGKVGEKAFVGLGAVVIDPVPPGETVVGNPARILRKKKS